MPRTARIAPREYVYHILCRGNNKHIVFKDDDDRQRYLEILKKYKESHKFRLYHFVLMSNHVHLVLEVTKNGGELSEIMKGINLSYVLHFKKKYEHVGHFWQDRYKSILISKDNYLLACGSYVELNPVRAGIVINPGDYKWSSYGGYARGESSGIVDRHQIYEDSGRTSDERELRYRQLIKGMIKDNSAMRGEMDRRVIYGSETFTDKIGKKYKVETIIRIPGRPKKLKSFEK